MNDWEYMGWVPCLNGHLDFGLMRVGIKGPFTDKKSKKNDLKIININKSVVTSKDSHHRKILLQSKVNWKDTDTFNEEDGWFRIFVTAEAHSSTNMDGRFLTGSILIYPVSAEPQGLAERQVMGLHKESHNLESISEARDSINPNLSSVEKDSFAVQSSSFDRCFSLIEDMISGQTAVENFDHDYFFSSFSFRVESNGIIWLKSLKNTAKPDIHYIIARQAYYYLKYSLHTHKHHQATQDALTTIVALEKDVSNDVAIKDAGLRLVCQLKRELTSLNRIKSARSDKYKDQLILNDACGIIAYGKALIRSLADMKIFEKDLADREIERFNDLKSSSDALNNKMEKIHSITELVSSKSKVIVGVIVGLFYFVLGRQFVNFSELGLSVNLKSIPEAIVFFGVIGASFLVMYFVLRRFYAWKHGLENPYAAQTIYNYSWGILFLRVGAVLLLWALALYLNSLYGDYWWEHLTGLVRKIAVF